MLRHTARAIVLHENKLLLMERWRQGMHYFSVPGGGVEAGETAEQTVVRELLEETSCLVVPERLLYTLQSDEGAQHTIFLCRYVSGEPHLPADAPEAQENDENNRFVPGWVATADLAAAPFAVWHPVKERLLYDLAHGFSDTPQVLAWKPEPVA